MTKKELITKIQENINWEGMEALIWETGENDYHLEIMPENATIIDTNGYLGRIKLSAWYWGYEFDNLADDIEVELDLLRE